MRRRVPAIVAACALALLPAGCGDDDEATSDVSPTELTVSAASSLTEAFTAYGNETADLDEKFSFAGSDDLAAQIRKSAPVDVFASANTSLPDDLYSEGLVEEPVTFISNRLVIAVRSDSDITSIDDLTAEGLDLVIGAEGVPVGDYTREVLDRLPSDQAQATINRVRSEEPDVKSIVGKLTAGAADAGFVYSSDVHAAGDELRAIELPADLDPVVSYGVAVVAGTGEPDAAQEFIDGLLDGAGRDALIDADFSEPEGG